MNGGRCVWERQRNILQFLAGEGVGEPPKLTFFSEWGGGGGGGREGARKMVLQ